MATYLAKFVPNFSEVTAPIRTLLDKDVEFLWDVNVHGLALTNLRSLLKSAPVWVLQFFDSKAATTVQCDASQNGPGACLLQQGRPVAYASRALTQTKQRYAEIEKETLAILFALEKFHTYVYGCRVTVQTDHKPLISIFKKTLTNAPRRLQRMLLRLQNYEFDLVFKPGTKVVIADTLSRAFPSRNNESSPSEHFTEDVTAITGQGNDNDEEVAVLIASEKIKKIVASAAKFDDSYATLANQIRLGWPKTPHHLPSEIRESFPILRWVSNWRWPNLQWITSSCSTISLRNNYWKSPFQSHRSEWMHQTSSRISFLVRLTKTNKWLCQSMYNLCKSASRRESKRTPIVTCHAISSMGKGWSWSVRVSKKKLYQM